MSNPFNRAQILFVIRFPEAPPGKLLSEKLAVDCNAVTDYHSARMQFIDLDERLLRRPLLGTGVKKSRLHDEIPRYLNLFKLSSETQIGTRYAQKEINQGPHNRAAIEFQQFSACFFI